MHGRAVMRQIARRAPMGVPAARLARRVRRRPVTVAVGPLELRVPADMAWAYRRAPVYYEGNVVHWIQRIAARVERPVVFDVGANVGFYTLLLAPQVERVFAFEPVRETFARLCANIERNRLPRVTPFQVALADRDGEAPIRVYSSSGNNSLRVELPDDHFTAFVREETITLATLDGLVGRGEAEPPNLIKIDVEGSEADVLRGASQTLAHARPVILAEHNPQPWFEDAMRDDLLTTLDEHDYAVRGLNDDCRDLTLYELDRPGLPQIGNVIAVPREREPLLR